MLVVHFLLAYAAPPEPTGTWVVASTTVQAPGVGEIGTIFHFGPGELAFRAPAGFERRAVVWEVRGEELVATGRFPVSLSTVDGGLALRSTEPMLTLGLKPATPEQAKAFEAEYARSRSAGDACAAALECCRIVMPMLGGGACREEQELGDRSSMRECEATIDGFGALLARFRKTPPAVCIRE